MVLLTERQVAEKLGYTYTSFRSIRSRKPDRFPKPKNLGSVKRVVWVDEDVDRWISEHLAK